uniref:Uncharacterized protein n=1 Tax=Spongospora subterranea TaxID=70186 RepID=A0A0H5RCG9_9EUKA|eukprot:CRZ11728.1 hypothetical protein [Spongospora subterranea]
MSSRYAHVKSSRKGRDISVLGNDWLIVSSLRTANPTPPPSLPPSRAVSGKSRLAWTKRPGSANPPYAKPPREEGVNVNIVPNDGIVVSVDPQRPGCPIVFRYSAARETNPERLNLNKRGLSMCPILQDEGRLRLLNMENNSITQITNLYTLPNLIFLDLYNNQISHISGLECLTTLRVLMLGKNMIKKIENLSTLHKLDVLDLHSNEIEDISGLDSLRDLRVLNLAGNAIKHVVNVSRLSSLTELNLRKNQIQSLDSDLLSLPSLSRIFLSHNRIASFSSVEPLIGVSALSELSLDGNPVADELNYRQMTLNQLLLLKVLDGRRIGQDERKAVMTTRLLRSSQHSQCRIELIQSDAMLSLPVSENVPAMSVSRQAAVASAPSGRLDAIQSVIMGWTNRSRQDSQTCILPTYHEFLNKKTELYLYGPCLDVLVSGRYLGLLSVSFHYIDFNEIASYFMPIRDSIPQLKRFSFQENDIHTYYQIDTLSVFYGLCEMEILSNPLNDSLPDYRMYLIFRVPSLQHINSVAVDADERSKALLLFEPLKQLWKTESIRKTRGFCQPTMIMPRNMYGGLRRSPLCLDVLGIGQPLARRPHCPFGAVIETTKRRCQAINLMDTLWPSMVETLIKRSIPRH